MQRVWSALKPDLKEHEVSAGHEAHLARGYYVLVAVGGGGLINAKGVAILAANGGNIPAYEGWARCRCVNWSSALQGPAQTSRITA